MGLTGQFLLSFLWGFAEATFFFIVPDVLLSYMCVSHGPRRAFLSALFALGGALGGGLILYYLGQSYQDQITAFIDALPAISPIMIQNVEDELKSSGLITLFIGAFSGVPYKIFAVKAGLISLPVAWFVLVSIPARLFRWVIVIAISGVLATQIAKRSSKAIAIKALITIWIIFYGLFFLLMPN